MRLALPTSSRPASPPSSAGWPNAVALRASVRHPSVRTALPTSCWGHIDMRTHTKILSALRPDTSQRVSELAECASVTSTEASAWDSRCRDTHRTDEQTAWNQQWKGPIMRTKLKDHPTRGRFDRYGNDDCPDGAAGEDGCGRLGVRSDRRKPQPCLRLVNGLPLSRWFAFAFSGSGSSCISSRN
jgi:hypothetical protein